MRNLFHIALFAAATAVVAGCDDPLDVNPRASIPAEEALDDAVEVELAVMGLYDGLQDADGAYGRNAVVFPDLWAETLDFTGTYQTDREVDQHTLTASNVATTEIWGDFYDVVNRANNVLASLPNAADEADAGDLARWEGEARFARALSYLNLVRFFGDVPLLTEPTWSLDDDYQPARAPMADVYALIESDLGTVLDEGLLPVGGTSYTATHHAAQALLAKALLEQQSTDATACAAAVPLLTDVIESGEYTLLPDYDDVFEVEDNAELIFSLEYTTNDSNAQAFWFFSEYYGGRWGFAPSAELVASYEGAERYNASVVTDPWGDTFGYKFRRIAAGDDDVPVLRLADVYLMRAEANLCQGAPAATVLADINEVRERAGVPLLDPAEVDTEAELLDALVHERMLELAMEGHRFFDLRRLGVAPAVLGIDAWQLWMPVPQRELDTNPNLTQNTGY